ncbi:hypothetical protein DFH09DRAFT_1160556 [Mycena vulgaris]|nr:hypothetical protein DFH09DRAFT_1160556 [Mycena vulgaris]
MTIQLLLLPPELLLVILNGLDEDLLPHNGLLPSDLANFRSIRDLRSVSAVNRQLRQLCLPLLFNTVKCTNMKRLYELNTECRADPEFARLIRRLDLVGVGVRNLLSGLLPRLPALARLDLKGIDFDPHLLTMANSHPTLTTVALYDPVFLQAFLSSPNLSKILVCKMVVDHHSRLESETLPAAIQLGAKFSHLIMKHEVNFDHDRINSLLLPGLEQLDLELCRHNRPLETWLPNFAQRHTHLMTIKFVSSQGFYWRHLQDIPFAIPFVEQSGTPLRSFSIARVASWTSLKDWEVVQLGLLGLSLGLHGIAALKIAGALAPRLSALDLVMHGTYAVVPIRIDDFAEPFSYLTSLQTLNLTNSYEHLHAGGRTPWISSQRDPLGTSAGVTAHRAMLWYMARVAQQAPSLRLINITDAGHDGKGRFKHPWTLRTSYRVRNNGVRDLEVIGTPQIGMAARYSAKSTPRVAET